MLKKTLSKTMGLTLVAILALSACNKTDVPKEDPSVVLEKSITQAAKINESNADINVTFNDPESKSSGEVKVTVKEKSNATDLKNLQTEASIQATADLTVPQRAVSPDGTPAKKETGNITVDAAGNFKVSGDDVYASLTELKLDGEYEGLDQINAMLPIFIGPYMNEVVHLPLNKLEPLMTQANAQLAQEGQPGVDFQALKEYSANEMPKDLADSKMLTVSKDNGVESIKTISGESLDAYHYQIGFDAKGLETFLKKYNEKTKLIPEEEMATLFTPKAGEPGMAEMVEVLNQALDFQMWIGQKDYQVYKMEMKVNTKSLNSAIEKIEEISKKLGQASPFTEADMKFFKEGNLDISIIAENQPLDSFTVTKPTGEKIIDLGPMLDMAIQGAMTQMNEGPTTTVDSSSEGPTTTTVTQPDGTSTTTVTPQTPVAPTPQSN